VSEVRLEERVANSTHLLDALFSTHDPHTVRTLQATVLAVSKSAQQRQISWRIGQAARIGKCAALLECRFSQPP
jgi:hypothetical protein